MLTQQQRDAMARAQAGDWNLADAIELLAEGRSEFRGERLIGGIPQGGRLQLLVYGDDAECSECEGGEVVCDSCGHTAECSACDGRGEFVADLSDDGWRFVVNLNGDVVYDRAAGDPSDTPPLAVSLKTAWAQRVIAEYQKEIGALAAAAPSTQPSLATEEAIAA